MIRTITVLYGCNVTGQGATVDHRSLTAVMDSMARWQVDSLAWLIRNEPERLLLSTAVPTGSSHIADMFSLLTDCLLDAGIPLTNTRYRVILHTHFPPTIINSRLHPKVSFMVPWSITEVVRGVDNNHFSTQQDSKGRKAKVRTVLRPLFFAMKSYS